LLAKHPWAKKYLATSSAEAASGSGEGAEPLEEEVAHTKFDEPLDPLDVDLEAVYADVAADRATFDLAAIEGESNYRVKVRGGPWTMLHKGKATDVVTAEATKNSLAATFCGKYNCHRMQSYEYSVYGKVGGWTLAQEWARKMTYFFVIWLKSGDQDYAFTEADVVGFAEDPAFTEWAQGLAPDHKGLARATRIRELVPRQ
jgi:hypothetical protein